MASRRAIALVAFSPVARGFLSDSVAHPAMLAEKDIRRGMPRFSAENWPANAALLPAWRALAAESGCSGDSGAAPGRDCNVLHWHCVTQ